MLLGLRLVLNNSLLIPAAWPSGPINGPPGTHAAGRLGWPGGWPAVAALSMQSYVSYIYIYILEFSGRAPRGLNSILQYGAMGELRVAKDSGKPN